jgi:hypothetical protein
MNRETKMLECVYGKRIETVGNSTGQFITTHNKLLAVVNSLGASYTVDFVTEIPEKLIYVCTCKMTDPRSLRTVTAVGEVAPGSLYNDFDRLHPAYTASVRAFDRAAIQMLEIKENLYSYSEISKEMFFGNGKKENPERQTNAGMAKQQKREETGQEPKNTPAANEPAGNRPDRPCMPKELGDTILTGSLQGKKYEEVKNTPAMTQFINFLKERPNMTYGDELKDAQAKFFRKLV